MVGHREGHRQSGLVVGRFTGWWDIGRAIESTRYRCSAFRCSFVGGLL